MVTNPTTEPGLWCRMTSLKRHSLVIISPAVSPDGLILFPVRCFFQTEQIMYSCTVNSFDNSGMDARWSVSKTCRSLYCGTPLRYQVQVKPCACISQKNLLWSRLLELPWSHSLVHVRNWQNTGRNLVNMLIHLNRSRNRNNLKLCQQCEFGHERDQRTAFSYSDIYVNKQSEWVIQCVTGV